MGSILSSISEDEEEKERESRPRRDSGSSSSRNTRTVVREDDLTRVIHIRGSHKCKPLGYDKSWMKYHCAKAGETPQRCDFYIRNERGRLYRCNNAINPPGWRGCHVFLPDDGSIRIVPGCGKCNGETQLGDQRAMYVKRSRLGKYQKVIEGKNCGCGNREVGFHRDMFTPNYNKEVRAKSVMR